MKQALINPIGVEYLKKHGEQIDGAIQLAGKAKIQTLLSHIQYGASYNRDDILTADDIVNYIDQRLSHIRSGLFKSHPFRSKNSRKNKFTDDFALIVKLRIPSSKNADHSKPGLIHVDSKHTSCQWDRWQASLNITGGPLTIPFPDPVENPTVDDYRKQLCGLLHEAVPLDDLSSLGKDFDNVLKDWGGLSNVKYDNSTSQQTSESHDPGAMIVFDGNTPHRSPKMNFTESGRTQQLRIIIFAHGRSDKKLPKYEGSQVSKEKFILYLTREAIAHHPLHNDTEKALHIVTCLFSAFADACANTIMNNCHDDSMKLEQCITEDDFGSKEFGKAYQNLRKVCESIRTQEKVSKADLVKVQHAKELLYGWYQATKVFGTTQ